MEEKWDKEKRNREKINKRTREKTDKTNVGRDRQNLHPWSLYPYLPPSPCGGL